ncbi:MAG TPA: hypothetical protein VM204_06170, partial [Gaiellaceae bacterium]|nr:hypothetical protein [Gaiellaceae bacterium]
VGLPDVGLHAVALLRPAAGCGGGSEERDRVEAYIGQANAVQRAHARDVRRANEVYRELAEGKLSSRADVESVAAAERSIRRARDELARLRPPPSARGLHRALLGAYAASETMAADTTRLARYVPDMQRTLRPLEGVGRRLERRLRDAEAAEGQARALSRYAAGLDGLLARMRRLQAPQILFQVHQSQLLRLRAARDVARRLQGALERQDAVRTAELVLEFRRVGASRGGARLRRQAVELYGERLREVAKAGAAVQRERARLDRALT